ncbi:hypothetical protein PTKIN_Ptkin18bG0094900 [Pterospermum kingtungense]
MARSRTDTVSFHSKDDAEDWRARVYTIFVDRLSKRVSKKALWVLFDLFGKVVDVFIPKGTRMNRRRTTFAFSRYWSEREMQNAIRMGNNKEVDGWVISVKQASFGWQDRNRWVMNKVVARKEKRRYEWIESSTDDHVEMKNSEDEVEEENMGNGNKWDFDLVESVTFNKIPLDSDLGWFHCSAIGRLKDHLSLNEVCNGVRESGIDCEVCVLGGVSVLVKFEKDADMSDFIKNFFVLGSIWFDELQPWKAIAPYRKIDIWVSLQEVPLQLWDVSFFKTLGDKWGTFIRLDQDTANLKLFDVIKMLISVDSVMKDPSIVTVKHHNVIFKILVLVDDEMQIKDDGVETCVAIT